MRNIQYEDFIQRVQAECDIVALVSEYVSLKKKGRNFWGCCPFHNEQTPSFSVSPDKGFFYCFGCQTGGNAFNFLMKVDGLPFREAVEKVAQKIGIPIPECERSSADLLLEEQSKEHYRINGMARDFFHSCLLNTSYGRGALSYLCEKRGLDKSTLDLFKIGFAPDSWDKLTNAFTAKGVTKEILLSTGLVSERNSGDGCYDRFRNRIMFPICDVRGRVIGFGGRVLDDSHPKYLNSQETMLFNKRRVLFGIEHAQRAIRDSGQAIVVEGYLDAITVFASGVHNVVASLGTAFTHEQGRIIGRYAKEVVFAFDSDTAGQSATLKALDIARTLNLNPRVAMVPNGKDPDEFVRRQGAEEFRRLIKNSMSLIDYQMRQVMSEVDLSRLEGKVTVVSKVLPLFNQLDNAIEIDGYITKLAQTLSIDEGAIRDEYRKINNRYGSKMHANKKAALIKNRQKNSAVEKNTMAEQFLLRMMLEDKSLIPYVAVQIEPNDIQNENRREIFICLNSQKGKTINATNLSLMLSDAAGVELSQIMLLPEPAGDSTQLVDDYIKAVRLASLQHVFEQHRLRADELERLGDSNFLQELAESKRIHDEIRLLLTN